MIKALALGKTWEFQDPDDPDHGTDDATTFTLRALDSRVQGKLKDGAARVIVDPNKPDDEVITEVNMEQYNFATAQFGVEGWDKFPDPDTGEQVGHETDKRRLGGKSYVITHADAMARVPLSTIRKIAEDIRAKNELSETDAKN